jgi:hypothetical protein
MTTPGITSDDMSAETRDYINCNLKEGLTPEVVFDDWGELDSDHPDSAHDSANGIAATRDEYGMGVTTYEETEIYRDSFYPEDIEIL